VVQGVLLMGLVPAMIACTVWYATNVWRWARFLKQAGAGADTVAERQSVLASGEYRAVRRAVRLPLNLTAACALLLYLVLRWQ
jgi:hypothetical protein